MKYKVIVKDNYDSNEEYYNSLEFLFDDLDEATDFAGLIMQMSKYHTEILQIEEEN